MTKKILEASEVLENLLLLKQRLLESPEVNKVEIWHINSCLFRRKDGSLKK